MIYRIENDRLRVEVNSLGSELWSVYDKQDDRECLWQGDPAVWPRRSPNLFPVCGLLREGMARIDGGEYKIPLHGFLRDYHHVLIGRTADTLRFRFEDNDQTRQMYPFRFAVETEFRLTRKGMTQTFYVENRDKRILPFSIGFHTGWNCPFGTGRTIEDYRIVFEKNETADHLMNKDLIVTGAEPYLADERIIQLKDGALTPNIALQGLTSKWVRIEEVETGRCVQVGIQGFPTVVLWSVPENMPFVCVEPWHGSFEPGQEYGELEAKPGICKLAPNEVFQCSMEVEFLVPAR